MPAIQLALAQWTSCAVVPGSYSVGDPSGPWPDLCGYAQRVYQPAFDLPTLQVIACTVTRELPYARCTGLFLVCCALPWPHIYRLSWNLSPWPSIRSPFFCSGSAPLQPGQHASLYASQLGLVYINILSTRTPDAVSQSANTDPALRSCAVAASTPQRCRSPTYSHFTRWTPLQPPHSCQRHGLACSRATCTMSRACMADPSCRTMCLVDRCCQPMQAASSPSAACMTGCMVRLHSG